MNIGIDFHDTISYSPYYFKDMMKMWMANKLGQVYIITGTPKSLKKETINQLAQLDIHQKIHYNDILMGFEYNKENMSIKHFKKMRKHKLDLIKKFKISIYYDDNPYYAQWMKDNGIITFMPCISKEYMEYFQQKDAFFTCHLQERMFNYLDALDDRDVLKKEEV